MGPAADLIEFVVDVVEVADARLLVVEDLDDLLAVHHLLGKALHGAGGFLLLHKVLGAAAAHDLGHKEHGDNSESQHQCQPDAEIEHDGKYDQHDRARLDQGRQCLRDELPERIDVVGIVGHDVPMLVGVKVRDRKILHSVEHLAAQLVEKALGHVSHDLRIAHKRDQ